MFKYLAFTMLVVIGAQIRSAPVTVTSRVSVGAGDVEVYNNTMYLADQYIYMAKSGPLGCNNGFYFNMSALPRGAQITKAYLTFKSSGAPAPSSSDNMRIYGEANDSSVIFTTAINYNARIKTVANVLWQPTPWVIGTIYNSIDFSPIIQEIIDRPNWKGPITILIYDEAATQSDRRAVSFENDPNNATALVVEYVLSTGVPFPITLTWTAKGDDGDIGTASLYDIRYATDSLVLRDWTNAIQIQGEPVPQIAGSSEAFSFVINAEENMKYFFAIKVADEAMNWSGLSNIAHRTLLDTIPPSMITNFETR